MVELSHWKSVVVVQRNVETGCIPTGYEWMIRYQDVKGINLDTFQDDFDLGRSNSFDSVAKKVNEEHPQIDIKTKGFDYHGGSYDKIRKIRGFVKRDIPCLMALALSPEGGWHVVPIVKIGYKRMNVIWGANQSGDIQVCELTMRDVIFRHDNWIGGKDIAWLEK